MLRLCHPEEVFQTMPMVSLEYIYGIILLPISTSLSKNFTSTSDSGGTPMLYTVAFMVTASPCTCDGLESVMLFV